MRCLQCPTSIDTNRAEQTQVLLKTTISSQANFRQVGLPSDVGLSPSLCFNNVSFTSLDHSTDIGSHEEPIWRNTGVIDLSRTLGALHMESCKVFGYTFLLEGNYTMPAFIRARNATIIETLFSNVNTNIKMRNSLPPTSSPGIANVDNLRLERVRAVNNTARSYFMFGGLFAARNATILNSTFSNNYGYSQFGYGLILALTPGANYISKADIEDTTFEGNFFLIDTTLNNSSSPFKGEENILDETNDGNPDDSTNLNAITSGCAIFAMNQLRLQLTISNCVFRLNVAPTGTALASQDIPGYSAESSIAVGKPTFSVSFKNTLFEDNFAYLHGVGSIILLDGILDKVDSQSEAESTFFLSNSTLTNNLAPEFGTRPLASPLAPMGGVLRVEPTLIELRGVKTVQMWDLNISAPVAVNSQYWNQVTRILVDNAQWLDIASFLYADISATTGKGALLLVRACHNVTIRYVEILPTQTHTRANGDQFLKAFKAVESSTTSIQNFRALSASNTFLDPWTLISFESGSKGAIAATMNHLKVCGWMEPEKAVSFISSSDIARLNLLNIDFQDIISPQSTPLIRISSNYRESLILNMTDSSFRNVRSLIRVTQVRLVLIRNITIFDYENEVVPAIALTEVSHGTFTKIFVSTSSAPALWVSCGENTVLLLEDSRFDSIAAGRVGTDIVGGAFIAEMGQGGSHWFPVEILVRRCRFSSNTATSGAAIYMRTFVNLTVTDSDFELNDASQDGAAIFVQYPLQPTTYILRCRFGYNSADRGGAIFAAGPLTIRDSIFIANRAFQFGGAIALFGTPFDPMSDALTTTIFNTTFDGNVATSHGGAIGEPLAQSSPPGSLPSGSLSLSLCRFHNNKVLPDNNETNILDVSGVGGAVATQQKLNMADSLMTSNAANFGAGLFLQTPNIALNDANFSHTFENSTFDANGANAWGGAIFFLGLESLWNKPLYAEPIRAQFSKVKFKDNSARSRGGAIATFASFPNFMNSSEIFFEANNADGGGALYIHSAPYPAYLGPASFKRNRASCCGAAVLYGNLTKGAQTPGKIDIFGDLDPKISDISSIFSKTDLVSSIEASSHDDDPKPYFDDNQALWGAERATSSLKLSATPLEGAIEFPDVTAPSSSSSPSLSFRAKPIKTDPKTIVTTAITYPGAVRSILISGKDQFGQVALHTAISSIMFHYRFICSSEPSECGKIAFLVLKEDDQRETDQGKTQLPNDDSLSKSSAISLTKISFQMSENNSARLETPIEGYIEVSASWDLTTVSPLATVQTGVFIPATLPIRIQSCGAGFGLSTETTSDSKTISLCKICPLFHYSLNGTCSICAYDQGVESCYGDKIIAPPTWWVMKEPSTNYYKSVRCGEPFCGPGNTCLLGRRGTLCGECMDGLHQSITNICIDCARPNVGMILLMFAALWVGALLLHAMIAASSGKATILIFFAKTAWNIRAQTAVVGSALPDFVGRHPALQRLFTWALCLWPMDYLDRKMVFAAVPFIMMLQIAATFILFKIYVRLRSCLVRAPRLPIPSDTDINGDVYSEEDSNNDKGAYVGRENNDDEEEEIVSDPPQESSIQSLPNRDNATDSMFFTSDDDSWSMNMVKRGSADDFESEETNSLLSPIERTEASNLESIRIWHIQNRYFHHYRLIRTILALYAMSFSTVLGIVTSALGCLTLLDHRRVLLASTATTCDSTKRRLALFLFIPWLLLVPASMTAKLLHAYIKNRLSQQDVKFGMWYEMYKPKLFAWKVTEFARLSLVSTIGNLAISEPSLRASLLSLCMIVSFAVQLTFRPYRQKLENNLETLSLFSLSFIALLVLWHARVSGGSTIISITSLVLLVVITLVLASSFSWRTVRSKYLRYKQSKLKST